MQGVRKEEWQARILLVLFDVREAVLLISQSLSGTFLTKPSNEILRIASDLFRKLYDVHSS